MTNWNERNIPVIEEFRKNGGKVAGRPEGSLLLITTTGAKTGTKRTTPLMYTRDGERFVVIASKGGSLTNPDWYHNIVAHPLITVEVGAETFEAKALIAKGHERDELYAKQVEVYPFFADYQKKVTRTIPLLILERSPEPKKASRRAAHRRTRTR